MGIGTGDFDFGEFADFKFAALADDHAAINFRGIGSGARNGAVLADRINQYRHCLADFAFEPCGTDFFLHRHEPRLAFLLFFFRYRIGQGVGGGAFRRAALCGGAPRVRSP